MFKLGYNLKNNSKKQKLLSYQIQIGLIFELHNFSRIRQYFLKNEVFK